jgi:hypothetical protein
MILVIQCIIETGSWNSIVCMILAYNTSHYDQPNVFRQHILCIMVHHIKLICTLYCILLSTPGYPNVNGISQISSQRFTVEILGANELGCQNALPVNFICFILHSPTRKTPMGLHMHMIT